MAYNPYFTYPNIELWQRDSWSGKGSCILPLADYIYRTNLEKGWFFESASGEGSAEYAFDYRFPSPKTMDFWKSKNMRYGFCGLGGVCLVPEEYYSGAVAEPPALLVLCEAKRWNPTRVDDIFSYYRSYNEFAAKERMSVLYIPVAGRHEPDACISILLELAAVCHIKYTRLYLDVSTVYNSGINLKEVPGFQLRGSDGEICNDPDMAVLSRNGIPWLDISGIWGAQNSVIYGLMGPDCPMGNLDYDMQAMVHSPVGREIAQYMALEHHFADSADSELIDYWNRMGLKCEFRHYQKERYVLFTPLCAFRHPETLLPLMVIFQEVNDADRHQAITGISYCSGMLDIAGKGDCILLYFALETVADNDLLSDILREVSKEYPIDTQRIYLMGHSHDGGLVQHYIRRHPDEIAACATLGVFAGLVSAAEMGPHLIAVEDEDIERMRCFDVPTVIIDGYNEKRCHYPLNSDIQRMNPGHKNCLLTQESRILSWQRRLRAYNCPPKSSEEIAATATSQDYIERKLGIPADKTECLYMDGFENYIADIKNNAGRYHLRVIGLGNMPHTVTPLMCRLLWSFVRRFARNRTDGSCIELF